MCIYSETKQNTTKYHSDKIWHVIALLVGGDMNLWRHKMASGDVNEHENVTRPLAHNGWNTLRPTQIGASFLTTFLNSTLRWRHNDHAGVSNHQPHGCLLNRLFRRKSKKTSKLRVSGLCAGNSPGTGEFPAQMASYAENVSIWWRHHDLYINLDYGFTEVCSQRSN